MSETVIISKTSPRQRPQPREPTAATVVGSTICNVGDTGRLEKLGSKSKSTASLVMVKELVHRDSSRLVKDLMALLAIREATKEATTVPIGTQSNEGEGLVELRKDEMLHKNRPGDTTVMMIPTIQDEEAEQGGTKPAATAAASAAATMTAAAVASLLHHTATKEFSSLAGEIIAIADDTPTANSNEDKPLDGSGMRTVGTGDDEMMLHADATAPELNTSENSTDEAVTNKREDGLPVRRKNRPLHEDTKGEVGLVGARYEVRKEMREHRAKTDVTEIGGNLPQRPNVEYLLSGPVPVSFPSHNAEGGDVVCGLERSATPIPMFGTSYRTGICHGLVSPKEMERPVALTLEQKLDKLLDSVVKIKADMHRRIDRLGKRVEQIHLDVQLNIDSTDRALLRNDLLLIGIPHREREDLQQCFRAVCRALEYTEQDIPQVDIRRQRVPGGSRRIAGTVPSRGVGDSSVLRSEPEPIAPAPIVVEFMFKTLRDQFYRAYQAKRVLRLTDIGFSSDRRFFVNEVLTKYNQKLMAEAVRRKRIGLLHSVYTVDGIVYVQRVAGEKGTKVTSFSSLN